MTTNAIEETAKIIPFPKGGRAGQCSPREAEQFATLQTVWVPCGGVSYHEEAIREDARTRDWHP